MLEASPGQCSKHCLSIAWRLLVPGGITSLQKTVFREVPFYEARQSERELFPYLERQPSSNGVDSIALTRTFLFQIISRTRRFQSMNPL